MASRNFCIILALSSLCVCLSLGGDLHEVQECGGELTAPTQLIAPSKEPGQYNDNMNCTWVIKAPEGKNVVLQFEQFDIEPSNGCRYDKLVVVEGEKLEGGKQLAMYCGRSTEGLPPMIRTAGNVMTVMFQSDASMNNGGMQARITFADSIPTEH